MIRVKKVVTSCLPPKFSERMDSWVPENNISDNLIKDFKAGIEYAPQDKVYTPPTYAPSGIKMKTKSATLVKVFAGLSFFRFRSPLLCDLAVGRWCTAKLGRSDLIANVIINRFLTSAALYNFASKEICTAFIKVRQEQNHCWHIEAYSVRYS